MVRVLRAGTRGLLVEVGSLEQVLGLHAALAATPLPGVAEVVPAARTLLLVLDGTRGADAVAAAVHEVRAAPTARGTGEVVEVATRYDGDDLDDVAAALGCSAGDVVAAHTAATWTVAFTGFAPGFGYLVAGDADEAARWQVPRRSRPRTRVPAGAVGLAGGFTGVYPRTSPGGWQLVGRTDLTVFDAAREPAALLRPGVRVRFRAVGA